MTGYIANSNVFPEPLSMEEEIEYIKNMKWEMREAKNILIEKKFKISSTYCEKVFIYKYK